MLETCADVAGHIISDKGYKDFSAYKDAIIAILK
jgi:uncharacterized protein YutE (UPF0331/DUF86 family)